MFQRVMVPLRKDTTYAATDSAKGVTPTYYRKNALLVSSTKVYLTDERTTIQAKDPHNHHLRFGNSVTEGELQSVETKNKNLKQNHTLTFDS